MPNNCNCVMPHKGEFKYESINMDCPKTWDLFAQGRLLGVFQLESGHGIRYSRELKPTTIEHLSALTAILRPGTTHSYDENGKSLTQKYCDRKNGKEPIIIEPVALTPMLEDTYGILVYQESQILIAKELCGFSLSEADSLRKAVGKKDAHLLFSLQEQFVNGAIRVGKINKEEATKVFEWIKAAARYSFNKCLDGKTSVETPNGHKYINNVEIGDLVRIPNHHSQEKIYSKVVNLYNNGPKQLFLFKIGKEWISCTNDHKFLCGDLKLRPIQVIKSLEYPVLNNNNELVHITKQVPDKDYTDTYDIEIEHPDHVFYADGLAVSNSHSLQYGLRAYKEAYLKTHFPIQFYTSKLKSPRGNKTKIEEADLIYEMKHWNIQARLPDLRHMREQYYNDGESIYFGLSNIKGLGESNYLKLKEVFGPQDIEERTSSFFNFAMTCARYLSPSVTELLIMGGAVDFFQISRTQMLEEYRLLANLTQPQQDLLFKYKDAQLAGVFQ